MKLTRIIAIAVILGSVGVGGLQAQSFRSQPAEFPPLSYKGKQYVDSKGCVFIRAGIDGNVTWVPRVSRKRQSVCGFKPSNVAAAAVQPTVSGTEPVQITLNNAPAQPNNAAKSAASALAVPATAQVGSRPIPAKRAVPVVVRQTAPKPAVVVAPRPVAVATATSRQIAVPSATCPGRSVLSQRYTGKSTKGAPVRCGPQSAPIIGARVVAAPVAAPIRQATRRAAANGTAVPGVMANTRIVPKHVAINRINTFNKVTVPKGYKMVWEDGRLNPKRAEQNLAGRSQMLLIWTNTVPRRLVNQSNGKDMTARMPLVYPYTSIERQRAELGEVTFATRDGQLVKRIVRNANAAPRKRAPVYSTRSSAKPSTARKEAKPAPLVIGNTYVQIGVYRDSANAQKTAQRIARMGMGARIGKSTRSGKTYLSVQAGPFAEAAAPSALGKLRGVGYSDAYIR